MVKRVLVAYCVDVDACAGWINTKDDSTANASDVSRGVFGANTGTDRMLKLFKDHDILASWYMPSHSILSFPTQMAKVRDAGHEIGLHGYTHEFVSRLTEDQERKVMAKSIEVYKEFTGKHPKGWVAPAWEISPRSMQILQDFGIEYDHSMMHHDCQPYYVSDMPPTTAHTDYSKDPDEWMIPMPKHTLTTVVEIPGSWNVDDWPPMHFSVRNPGTHGFVNPRDIEVQWKDQFDFFYREYESFVFTISCHPQVSGRSNIQLMHERLIAYLKSHEGVEFMTMAQICDEYKAGKIAGVTVTAGV
ncbi:related to polysaccharide deacetylase family protein [Phialocephala subalpina]|uniref:Related to polysaccharide deacetylase family protein n=1 Tax=Phialocephala subalpina TaxID=576137 RepID=A0A1L7X1A3_9HELO|nr:related to polysaccharide deacetylase family protein [Phialocephala subalpina]